LAEKKTRVRKGKLSPVLDDRQIAADLDGASAKTRSTRNPTIAGRNQSPSIRTRPRERAVEDGCLHQETMEQGNTKSEEDKFEISRESEMLNHCTATERIVGMEKEKTRINAR